MTTDHGLPNGWTIATVGEIATYQNGRAFKPSEWRTTGLPIIRIQNLNSESAVYNFSDAQHESRFKVKHGDLLFAWSASLGAHLWSGEDAWLNQHIFRVDHAQHVSRRFLYYALVDITNALYTKAHGSGMVHVTKRSFEETGFRLPPLNEQRRIAAKIDELFSELDKGIESLKTARTQLAAYRQSVLKHAFEGKLTAQWREENKDELETSEQLLARIKQEREARYAQQIEEWKTALKAWETNGKSDRKPRVPRVPAPVSALPEEETSQEGVLPDGWLWLTVESVGRVQLGRQRSPRNRSKDYATKYVRAANITETGTDLGSVLDMDFPPHDFAAYQLRRGDLLLSEASGSASQVGKPAIWNDQVPRCCFQNTVIRHQPYRLDHAAYLLWLYRFLYVTGRFARAAGGVGINHLGAFRFAQIALPLCSLPEQQEIVQRLERRFTAIERSEQEIGATLRRTETLRQLILKRAFSGQLVPQDPNDEPASALLGRIRAERERSANHRRRAGAAA